MLATPVDFDGMPPAPRWRAPLLGEHTREVLGELGFDDDTSSSLLSDGVAVTTVPLILAMYVGKYLFRFDDAILLGACSGARTTTASLGMINDRAKSQIPGLGYTVTYAVGNTLLTVWGMVLVILLT